MMWSLSVSLSNFLRYAVLTFRFRLFISNSDHRVVMSFNTDLFIIHSFALLRHRYNSSKRRISHLLS